MVNNAIMADKSTEPLTTPEPAALETSENPAPAEVPAPAANADAAPIVAVDPTDEYRDADIEQSGYLPNHNMDPAIVDSPQFGQLWKIAFNKNEQVRNSPLH